MNDPKRCGQAARQGEFRRRLRERLAAGPDPAAPRSDFHLNPELHPGTGRVLKPAAVLVPIIDYPDEPAVLLTRRTAHLKAHAGQIAFPGGRVEEDDADVIATALRETEEETGITRDWIEPAGILDIYETSTGFAVTPVLGFLAPGFPLAPDPGEVSEVFEVPLSFVMNPANHVCHSGWKHGRRRQWYAMPYGEYYIWGATAGMLVNLSHRIGDLCSGPSC